MRGRWPGRIALVVVAVAALSACEDGTPVQRGYGSHQILGLRDSTFLFYAAKDDLLIYETGYGSAAATYWSINIETGEISNLGAMVPDLTDRPPPPPAFRCEYETDQNGLTGNFVITNTMSGEVTVIDRVLTALSSCPTTTDPTFEVWRKEPDGTASFWTGPYTDLHQVPLPLVVHQVFWKEPDATLVGAPAPGTADGLGVFAIPDQDRSQAIEVISPVLGPAAWAAGATPSTALASAGLAEPTFLLPSRPEHYTYTRAMADGSQVMFVGPLAATEPARELALFPIGPDANLNWLRIQPYDERTGSWTLTAWSTVEGNPPTTTFRIWREASARLTTCPWPADQYPRALADPTEENALFLVQRTTVGALSDPSPLLVMVPGASDGSPCRTVATNNVGYADFSPDGSAMVWLDEPPSEKATLWTAGRDGSAPRSLGRGYIPGALYPPSDQPHFVGDSQLELTLDTDLVWVDVHDDPVRTHYITERTFGPPLDLGRWVVTGHDYSSQDETGRLALVNRDSGETRPISPGVSYYLSPDLSSFGIFHDDGQPVRIVYLVRGRNPSAQDGLWVATITQQDRR